MEPVRCRCHDALVHDEDRGWIHKKTDSIYCYFDNPSHLLHKMVSAHPVLYWDPALKMGTAKE